jgi:hypothetical protein
MVAPHHGKNTAGIRELAFFNVLDPSTINPYRDIMFCFTSNRTSMATNTISIVDYKTKIQKTLFFI